MLQKTCFKERILFRLFFMSKYWPMSNVYIQICSQKLSHACLMYNQWDSFSCITWHIRRLFLCNLSLLIQKYYYFSLYKSIYVIFIWILKCLILVNTWKSLKFDSKTSFLCIWSIMRVIKWQNFHFWLTHHWILAFFATVKQRVWRRVVIFVFAHSHRAGVLVCFAMLIDHQCYYVFFGLVCLSAGCKTCLDCFYSHDERVFDRGESPLYSTSFDDFCMQWFTLLLNYCYFFCPENIYLSELFVSEKRKMRTNVAVALFCTLDLYALRFSIRGKSYLL